MITLLIASDPHLYRPNDGQSVAMMIEKKATEMISNISQMENYENGNGNHNRTKIKLIPK